MNLEMLAILFILLFYSLYAAIDYCKEDVGCVSPDRNTLCKYGEQSPCEQHKVTLTEEKRKTILKLHNNYRANMANTKTDSSYQKAGDMAQLTWDDELEKFAQRAASHMCVINGHDECCFTKRYNWVNQNFAMEPAGADRVPKEIVDIAFEGWTSEIKDFSPLRIAPFSLVSGGRPTNHFSQIIWAETRLVGCGESTYHGTYFGTPNMNIRVIVCNYAPGGNTVKKNVYTPAEPCTRCPTGGVCSTEHPGLCKIPLKEEDKEFAHSERAEEAVGGNRGTQTSPGLSFPHFLSLIFMILQFES